MTDSALRLAAEHGGRLEARPGVSGTVVVAITATSAGDQFATLVWVDGRISSVSAGAAPDPDLTLTLPAADARAMMQGELAPSVAFMQGRLKTAGDNGLVVGVLGAVDTRPAAFAAWVEAARHPESSTAP